MPPATASVRIDKLGLSHYLRNYEEYLGPVRDQPLKLLELGIANGDSLRYWRQMLPSATIAGLDIRAVDLDEPGVQCFQGEQQDPVVLDRIAAEVAPDGFDVVIDDASHVGQFTRLSFWHLYEHHLKPGGLYFIEDWGTGYWPDYPDGRHYTPPEPVFSRRERVFNALAPRPWVRGSRALRKAVGYLRWNWVQARFPSHDYGMVGFVKELVDECGAADRTHHQFGRGTPRASRLEWVRVSHGHVIVKKPDPYPPPMPAG
ncbi:class I SAM-dependent methyltransferase [Gemmata sp.]|uniref:class I SAM-dependent methyltransferase n=1 Tax=Gemmata sp. TaxID=1914242 RepID=UPI003F727304